MNYTKNLPDDPPPSNAKDNFLTDLSDTLQQFAKDVTQCLCRHDWIADPDDVPAALENKRYPRSLIAVTYAATCPVPEHRTKAGNVSVWNLWVEPPVYTLKGVESTLDNPVVPSDTERGT
jgi:hypothetical protein